MSHESIGISHLAYALPDTTYTLKELAAHHLLDSSVDMLESFGFGAAYINEHREDLLARVGHELIADIDPDDVAALYVYSGVPTAPDTGDSVLDVFKYDSSRLHHELGLSHARALSFGEQGCSGLFSMIDFGRTMLAADADARHVMCLTHDALPHGSSREILYNVMSDAAGGVVLTRGCSENRIVHSVVQTQSYYWDTPHKQEELLAAYFPLAHKVIERCVTEAGLTMDDIAMFVPHNVSLRSWHILAQLLDVPEEKIWSHNISTIGHTVSCDHVINLSDIFKAGAVETGDYLVLFTFGFGATWSCMIVQR